jgi:recombination protein RecR
MISSKYIESAVNEMASLPGVGRKTALRYVLELLGRGEGDVERFAEALKSMRANVKLCALCKNISDDEVCGICSNPTRDQCTVCVVEDIRDLMALEATHQYKGLYHVIGGKISPMDGIGPADLHITSFLERLQKGETKEVIFALSPTMEGDTTAYSFLKKWSSFHSRY